MADNIVYFARTLRHAGLRVGPAAVVDAINAVLTTGIGTRDDFYWTLHAIFVSRHEDHAVFDEAFRLFWKSRELIEKILAMLSPVVAGANRKEKPRAAQSRVSDAFVDKKRQDQKSKEIPEIEFDARFTASGRDISRTKDFAQMSAEELSLARQAIDKMVLPEDRVRTRRFRPDPRGALIDPRAMMRTGLRTGGDLILPRFRSHREVHPPLVVIADISGSMSQYTRIFLHFMHALTEKRRKVHTFVFGTRLTNLTREMRHRDPDEALAESASAVADWSGGTRIGEALYEFNRLWSRRVLSQGAVVLLITDGLERDNFELLEQEMERLHKSCRSLVWLNPLLRFEGFEAKARGVRGMLPHVDQFRTVHNLDSLADLCRSLSGQPTKADDPKIWLKNMIGKSAA